MTTALLIHGGASTARFWDRVVERVGRAAVAVDLPGRRDRPADLMTVTLDDGAASVAADLAAAAPEGPVVVVAHSSGGLVVPRVVGRLGDRVTAVVLTSASVPPDGGTGLDCMKASHRERMVAGVEWARAEGQRLVAPVPEAPEALRESYGERLDDDTLAFVFERLVEDSFNVYFDPVTWSTVAVPITYVRASRDRAVPPALQDEMIARLPGTPTVLDWDCGHIPPVTRPAEFSALLQEFLN
ncbi:MAG TPA: alpha/beta hydrolase [Acidimicrobiales bacterium]|jgi:pimeloyl-ACP methyl ester carboxylesterase